MNMYRQRSASVTQLMGGANLRTRTTPPDVPLLFSPTSSGHTALHMTVALGEREILSLLLSHVKQLSLLL